MIYVKKYFNWFPIGGVHRAANIPCKMCDIFYFFPAHIFVSCIIGKWSQVQKSIFHSNNFQKSRE